MSDCGELSLLLVSANVGTIFEQPDRLITPWLEEFCAKINREEPDFVALHCQEVGGKSYMTGMDFVEKFVEQLLNSPKLSDYSRVRGYLDEDYETKTEFTALGSMYLVHNRVSDAAMWDFSGSRFHPIADKEIKVENLRQDPFHKKLKYPPDFFPQFPWSRKGHIITRWRLRNRVVDMVNVHLFHDASNLESVGQSPSIYVGNRARALRHTLQKIQDLGLREAPLFIFGDFNFRVDLHDIVHKFLCSSDSKDTEKDGVVSSIAYRNADDADGEAEPPVLKLEKKGFNLRKPLLSSSEKLKEWRPFDKEAHQFPDLYEQKITFPPSYPFSEDEGVTGEYMKTRPPSWCDRVLYNNVGKELLRECSSTITYGVVGADAEMGDHKPVYLAATLPADSSSHSIGNNNHGNNVANCQERTQSHDDASAVEPSPKRVALSYSSGGESTAAATTDTGTAAFWRHMLIVALIYCCTLILLQYTMGVDASTAASLVLVLSATVVHFARRR